MTRLLSLAAGVQLDVAPANMVTVAHDAGWPAVGIWFDGKTWTDSTSREVRQRLDDSGVVALDIEPIIPSEDGDDFADQLVEAAAVIGAQHILCARRQNASVSDERQSPCTLRTAQPMPQLLHLTTLREEIKKKTFPFYY